MRKILTDGLKALPKCPRDNDLADGKWASLFVLGPSDHPHAAYAGEAVLEIAIRDDPDETYLVPLELVRKMLAKAVPSGEGP